MRAMTPLWAHEARTLDEGSRAAIVLAMGEALASRHLDAELLIQKRRWLAPEEEDEQRAADEHQRNPHPGWGGGGAGQ